MVNATPQVDNLLLADDFHQRALSAATVEFAVENLCPWAEIKFAFGDCDDFAAHDLAPTHFRAGEFTLYS
jgi:hypothetical protein